MDVLDDEDERIGSAVEESAHGLVQAAAAPGSDGPVADAGQESRDEVGEIRARGAQHVIGAIAQVFDEAAQRLDEGRVREEVGTKLHARSDLERRPSGRHTGAQLGHQTALADPRLAADEDDRALGAAGHRVLERRSSSSRPTRIGLARRTLTAAPYAASSGCGKVRTAPANEGRPAFE